MKVQEAQARIKARVWQAIAQGHIDTGGMEKATLENLVNLITEAALMEIDEEIGEILVQEDKEAEPSGAADEDEERVLWAGRPFLSPTTHYTITSERIKIRSGLLGKAYDYVELIRIQDLKHTQSFGERLLKVGDVIIRSHDPSHPTLELNNVQDPQHVYEILRDALKSARKRHNFSYREEM